MTSRPAASLLPQCFECSSHCQQTEVLVLASSCHQYAPRPLLLFARATLSATHLQLGWPHVVHTLRDIPPHTPTYQQAATSGATSHPYLNSGRPVRLAPVLVLPLTSLRCCGGDGTSAVDEADTTSVESTPKLFSRRVTLRGGALDEGARTAALEAEGAPGRDGRGGERPPLGLKRPVPTWTHSSQRLAFQPGKCASSWRG